MVRHDATKDSASCVYVRKSLQVFINLRRKSGHRQCVTCNNNHCQSEHYLICFYN